MCLKIDYSRRKKFRSGKFTAYKTFVLMTNGLYRPRHQWVYGRYGEKVTAQISKDGYYISNRRSKKLSDKERYTNEANKGIHVYLNKHDAEADYSVDYHVCVVPVLCDKKDLVAFGAHSSTAVDQAVFMRVKIKHKKDLKRFKIKK